MKLCTTTFLAGDRNWLVFLLTCVNNHCGRQHCCNPQISFYRVSQSSSSYCPSPPCHALTHTHTANFCQPSQTLPGKKKKARQLFLMPPVQPASQYQKPPFLCVSFLSSSRLTNGFSATQLCLPLLPRVITAEGSSASLKRSDFFLPLNLAHFCFPYLTVCWVTHCFLSSYD